MPNLSWFTEDFPTKRDILMWYVCVVMCKNSKLNTRPAFIGEIYYIKQVKNKTQF